MSDQVAWIVPTEQAPHKCGRKADRLRLMAKAGHRVPRSWVLPFESFSRVLEHNRASSPRSLVGVPQLPADLVAAITEVYDRVFAGAPVVVRSSAHSEDNAFASCAGQYESFLNRRTAAAVVEAVAACYASLNSRNARSYQDLYRLDMDTELMAVLIQEMMSPEHSGVLFTHDPVGVADVMTVESVPGLGTSVVAGQGTPDRRRIARWDVCRDPHLEQLRTAGLELEKLFGTPQDVEWGRVDGRLYIFQSRDMTPGVAEAPTIADLPDHPRSTPALAVSRGVAVGPVRSYPGEGPFVGAVLLVQDQSVDGIIDVIRDSAGVLLSSGGVLSHLATVIRELGRPALRLEQLPDTDGQVVVLDAVSGQLTALSAVPVVAAKQWIFAAARSASGPDRAVDQKVETVSFDDNVVLDLLDRLRKHSAPDFRGVQDIIPFDYMPMAYCSYSVRVQRTGDAVRVQYKRALKPDSTFREDSEVHVRVDSLDAAKNHMRRLGLTELPAQERALEVHRFAGCTFSFMRWPGSTRVYVGVDGLDRITVASALRTLGNSLDHRFRAVDGVQIFTELGLSLREFRFADRTAVRSGRLRVDDGPW